MADIAILVDTGTNVPQEYVDKYGIYVLPLMVNYAALTYRDGVDITAEQVIDRLELEIPKTSLPSMDDAKKAVEHMRANGITKVIAVTISAGLSGTNNMIRILSQDYPDMEWMLLDTKNIGIGAGITAMRAAELVEKGLSMDEIKMLLEKSMPQTKIFFSVATLKYLQKGGRIGLVTAKVGTLLGINPIISCNHDGVYYTVKKIRGKAAALEHTIDLVKDMVKGKERFNLFVAHGGAEEVAKTVVARLKKEVPQAKNVVFAPVSSALAVHTGPGLIGIGAQIL